MIGAWKLAKVFLQAGVICSFLWFSGGCSPPSDQSDLIENRSLATLVDPFIGTGGHGHTYPGVSLPFGMVQISPDNGTEGWDWSSGYHYSDSMIAGFSHLHLSGTGIGDYCDISFLPGYFNNNQKIERVRFSHKNEGASPGKYQVILEPSGIQVDLTATRRTGIQKYLFHTDSLASVSIDLGFHINWDKPTETMIEVVSDTLIVGMRKSTGWAKDQWVYFATAFSEPIKDFIIFKGDQPMKDSRLVNGEKTRAILNFGNLAQSLIIKTGISTSSPQGALENIIIEAPHWDFESYQQEASKTWEEELSKIKTRLISADLDTIFYTALYHAALAPSLHSDILGQYKGADHKIHEAKNFERYTVFSLWDTFRASHPLFTILQPKKNNDFLESILAFYHEYGLLPVWALAGNETNTMTGYHAVPVLADAILKGQLDPEPAYSAMKKSAMQDIRGTDLYREHGYIPADLDGWSVTKTLEYAYDDWCIAQVALHLDKEEDYQHFTDRAFSYKNLFDADALFMRGKKAGGDWIEPFDPFYSEHGFDGAYIEGTAWQHSWFVPHDVQGLINLFGDETTFIKHLDSTFNVTSEMTGENVSADISGMIGQYAHGNEPSHHIAYLYNYAGKPWKTQEKVRRIMTELYTTGPEGLPGNEDCGQMSAWFVFSALGFYPVNPAEGIYVIGSPLVHNAEIQTGSSSFFIEARNNSVDNIYIQEVLYNDQPYFDNFISHKMIENGGRLVFVMGPKPSTWGSDSRPPSMSKRP